MTRSVTLIDEPTQQIHFGCGTAMVGPDAGRCSNRDCQQQSPSLLNGLCVSCATSRLKATGCQPIKLTNAACGSK